jgi:hypothetical protein
VRLAPAAELVGRGLDCAIALQALG